MYARAVGSLLVALGVVVPLTIRADFDDAGRRDDRDCRDSEHHEHNVNTPVRLLGVIAVPGNPIMSTDIGWVDPGTERFYFADRSNFGVDIIDAEDNFYVDRVGGMAGPKPSGGGTSTTNGPGPNGVLVTPNRRLWAGDGNSTVQVADVDPDSPTYLKILASVNTANATCDTNTPPGNPASATGHWCGRADELGFDPRDRLILAANNAPLSPTKMCPTPTNPAAHCPVDPYATLIDARTNAVVGQITFKGAGGLEQPLWDPGLRRFWITVPGPAGGSPMIARIDPTKLPLTIDKSFALDCKALTGTASASIAGIALGPFQHLLVAACGFPIVLSALTGHVFNVVTQVGGGDEVWHNPGDNRYYVTAADTTTLVQSLGVIDAETNTWLQNVQDVRGRNPAAFAENNEVFTAVTAPAPPTVEDPRSPCVQFGLVGRGCIAVFGHTGDEDR
ncbi:MAG TPA: hypothetical protein VKE51_29600 [Vicinamibacterales bacterium]|nr:hypothetical protein [Vicinamibacterales bacterium]